MHYTIAIVEDVHNEQEIWFDKCGNEYLVTIHNKETKNRERKQFKSQNSAIEICTRLSTAILEGCYSYEQRAKMLLDHPDS